MTTPNRGRGRGGYGCGRSYGSNNMLPHQQLNIPIIGDWTTFHNRRVQQLPAPMKKEEIPSSSSSKIISYKAAAENEEPGFFENPNKEIILYIENEDIEIAHNDGWLIKTRYLESRGYPGLQNQARKNLEILLIVTESITVTHHFQNNNPESFINFSKCHINKVLSPKEWGLNPNGEKAIKIAEGKYIYYNYWDYIQAFSKAFYYQNPKNKHSWFFSVNPEILDKQVPNWFIEWWSKFGPSTEILPKAIKDLYNSWCDNSPLVLKNSKNLMFGQCPFFFITKFQIPWIWRWAVSIGAEKLCIPVLYRTFFFKWWKGMIEEDVQKIVEKIKTTISQDKNSEIKRHESDKDSISSLKDYFQKKYPCDSEEEIMVRILDHMKTQFFKSFPNTKEDDESMKTVSSPGSIDSSNTFNCLAGESQADKPTPEDFWDSLIASVPSKDKGKGAIQ